MASAPKLCCFHWATASQVEDKNGHAVGHMLVLPGSSPLGTPRSPGAVSSWDSSSGTGKGGQIIFGESPLAVPGNQPGFPAALRGRRAEAGDVSSPGGKLASGCWQRLEEQAGGLSGSGSYDTTGVTPLLPVQEETERHVTLQESPLPRDGNSHPARGRSGESGQHCLPKLRVISRLGQ